MLKYAIFGKKWRDKVNGNTYHNVTIIEISDSENKTIYSGGMVYGYGDQYKQTAYDWLVKNGLVLESDRFNHDLNRNRFIYSCEDVTKQSDLKGGD